MKPGDRLILHRESTFGTAGHLSARRENLSLLHRLEFLCRKCSITPNPANPVWFDDGKIGGVFRSVDSDSATVEITQARPEGEKLGAEKGINLPETRIDIPALTPDDLEALKFIVQHADLVGYSFVRTESDVRQLLERLEELGGQNLGLILKIETRKAFDNLPKLILASMRTRSLGVMIARGDLAVECGYQRLAEVQEEILMDL